MRFDSWVHRLISLVLGWSLQWRHNAGACVLRQHDNQEGRYQCPVEVHMQRTQVSDACSGSSTVSRSRSSTNTSTRSSTYSCSRPSANASSCSSTYSRSSSPTHSGSRPSANASPSSSTDSRSRPPTWRLYAFFLATLPYFFKVLPPTA